MVDEKTMQKIKAAATAELLEWIGQSVLEVSAIQEEIEDPAHPADLERTEEELEDEMAFLDAVKEEVLKRCG